MKQTVLSTANPTEILARLRRIEIRTSRLVNELFGGRYLSTFKGRGMEFNEIREYIPGDDIRTIDWNVTARLGHPFVKRFTEERELTLLMAVDVSGSQFFGTRSKLKSELAAELVSLLAFSSLKNNDKVGLLLFSKDVENYIPPRKTKRHILRLIRDVLGHSPQHVGTNIDGALQFLNRVQKKRAIVFLISDFMDDGFEKSLRLTQKHHDTIAFVIEDPLEQTGIPIQRLVIDDAEEDQRSLISWRGSRGGEQADLLASRRAARDLLLTRCGLDKVIFHTNEDYVKPLMSFFEERVKRFQP